MKEDQQQQQRIIQQCITTLNDVVIDSLRLQQQIEDLHEEILRLRAEMNGLLETEQRMRNLLP